MDRWFRQVQTWTCNQINPLAGKQTEELVPRHYNRFQMVLEDGADSKHQRKSVIVWWGENGWERAGWERTTAGTLPSQAHTVPFRKKKTTKTEQHRGNTVSCLPNCNGWIDGQICIQKVLWLLLSTLCNLCPLPYIHISTHHISCIVCSLSLVGVKQLLLLSHNVIMY